MCDSACICICIEGEVSVLLSFVGFPLCSSQHCAFRFGTGPVAGPNMQSVQLQAVLEPRHCPRQGAGGGCSVAVFMFGCCMGSISSALLAIICHTSSCVHIFRMCCVAHNHLLDILSWARSSSGCARMRTWLLSVDFVCTSLRMHA